MSSDRDNTFVKTVNGARGERDGREERPRQEEGSPVLTIPDLIDRIASQNRELDELKVQQAKCDATLTRLAKLEAENKALEDGLVQRSTELVHCKEQLQELIRENDGLKDALLDKDEQIRRAHAECHTRIYEIQHLPRESTSTQTVSNEQQGTDVLSDVPTGQSSLSTGVKRRKFSYGPSAVPQCRNCNVVFDKIDPASVQCSFHRANPQPYSVWKTQPDSKEGDKDALYWPCCEVFSRRLPPGCLHLRQHDIYYP